MISDCPDTYVSRSPSRRVTLRAAAVLCSVWSAVAIHGDDGFGDEIQGTLDLTMPETPTDPFDRLGEPSTGLTIRLRRIGPAHGRLCDVLNPHREMEPVEHMVSRPRAGGFAERSWTIGTIAQDGDRCRWRRSQSTKHTAQLSRL